jgi:hypothetical protein
MSRMALLAGERLSNVLQASIWQRKATNAPSMPTTRAYGSSAMEMG